jgi:hypothetical protein
VVILELEWGLILKPSTKFQNLETRVRHCKISDIGSHIIKVKKEKYYILEVTSQNQGVNNSQTFINRNPAIGGWGRGRGE